MMATAREISTARQLLETPGLGRCELVRGRLVTLPFADFEHGCLAVSVLSTLAAFVRRYRLGIVTGAETGFQIGHDPDTVRAPDVAFVRAERVPKEPMAGFFPGAPDLAVEVLSPNDRAGDVQAKVHDWLDAGCRLVWVVDPTRRTVGLYGPEKRLTVLGIGKDLDGGDVVPGFVLPVAEIFTS